MATAGYSYIVKLQNAHLDWGGNTRHTQTRNYRSGEGYIKIPSDDAYNQNILNSNGTGGIDVIGQNIFYCTSADGFFSKPIRLRAQGNQYDNRFAKQFSVDDNLRTIGDWYSFVNAKAGDSIEVLWTSPNDIVIRKI